MKSFPSHRAYYWTLGALLLLACLQIPSVHAQNNNDESYAQADLRSLPSGQLQAIDWARKELTINGKQYPFLPEKLRVYYQGRHAFLSNVANHANIRFQTIQSDKGEAIVRIWVELGGMVPS